MEVDVIPHGPLGHSGITPYRMQRVPFTVVLTEQADEDLAALAPVDRRRVGEALDRMGTDPLDPLLASYLYESTTGPGGEEVWESRVEPEEPDGLRIWWWFGREEQELTVLAIGPHPD